MSNNPTVTKPSSRYSGPAGNVLRIKERCEDLSGFHRWCLYKIRESGRNIYQASVEWSAGAVFAEGRSEQVAWAALGKKLDEFMANRG